MQNCRWSDPARSQARSPKIDLENCQKYPPLFYTVCVGIGLFNCTAVAGFYCIFLTNAMWKDVKIKGCCSSLSSTTHVLTKINTCSLSTQYVGTYIHLLWSNFPEPFSRFAWQRLCIKINPCQRKKRSMDTSQKAISPNIWETIKSLCASMLKDKTQEHKISVRFSFVTTTPGYSLLLSKGGLILQFLQWTFHQDRNSICMSNPSMKLQQQFSSLKR